MGKAYVVFKGKNPGVYDTWVETHGEVNEFKGALYKKFSSRAEAVQAYEEYANKRDPTTSCATSGSNSQRRQADKILQLEDALSDLQNDVLKIVDKMDDIKQKIQEMRLSGHE